MHHLWFLTGHSCLSEGLPAYYPGCSCVLYTIKHQLDIEESKVRAPDSRALSTDCSTSDGGEREMTGSDCNSFRNITR